MFISIVCLSHSNTGKKKPILKKKTHQKKNRIVLLQTTCVRDLMESVERLLSIFLGFFLIATD